VDLAFTPDVQALWKTVVWFANLGEVRSVEAVYREFSKVGDKRWAAALYTDKVVPERLPQVRDWQHRLQQMLRAAAERGQPRAGGDAGMEKFDAELDEMLTRAELGDLVTLRFRNGRLRQTVNLVPFGLWSACVLAVVLLIDRDRALPHATLQRCEAPTCGKFVLQIMEGRGRPSRYCSSTCRARGAQARSVARQRTYRERQKCGAGSARDKASSRERRALLERKR
jgi:hypothetical protein